MGRNQNDCARKDNKTVQTPYSGVKIQRYVYQTSKGGKIHCPLENNAQIIRRAMAREHKKELKYLKQAANMKNDGKFYQRCGEILLQLERWNEAIPMLKKALAKRRFKTTAAELSVNGHSGLQCRENENGKLGVYSGW